MLTEAAAPLVRQLEAQGRMKKKKTTTENRLEDIAVQEEIFMASELTVKRHTPGGRLLSLPAAVSVEQFGRMNGLTGRKMQKIFRALSPEHVQNDARSLVEYCCFRYLSRDSSDFHPSLKELAFQRLIFITMLAWEYPYSEDGDSHMSLDLQKRVVGEEAFVRIAPAIAGVADLPTVHHLFKALVGDEQGISLSLWTTYIAELIKIHQGRNSHKTADILLSEEQLLCIGSGRKRPVLKWENNVAWPGNLTLTDNALYFEVIGLRGTTQPIRLDLSEKSVRVEKARVGPFGSKLFDSAISVSSSHVSEPWVLEFVNFGGEMRRDVWHAFISEIISVYDFIREYGPEDDDPSIHHVYGAQKGKRKAIKEAANSIARLQSLHFARRLSEDPIKLVKFSYLRSAPYGAVVLQTLAVNIWGGPLITKFSQAGYGPSQWERPSESFYASSHVFDIDGSVYLRKWMKSQTWTSSSSVAFWKNSVVKKGIILSKNLVVADLNLVERASLTCKERSRMVEKTQATIDAAMIKGIPSNIDLFKELILPFVVMANKFDKLQRWEEPRWTISFLVFAYTVIFRNLLSYVFPVTLIIMATTMLLLKVLKEQGRLGRNFGKITIRDQPPSNTIQMIIGLREAMADMENFLQGLNIALLKIRTIILSGQPEVTTEVALVLLGSAFILLVVPFKYVLAFVLFDLFTRELEFRRETVVKFMTFLSERWAAVHAAPVVVLPYEGDDEAGSEAFAPKKMDDVANAQSIPGNGTSPKS